MTFREIFIDNYGWIGVLVAFVLAFSSELVSGLKAWRVLRWMRRPSSPSPETATPATDAAPTSIDDDWSDIAQQLAEETKGHGLGDSREAFCASFAPSGDQSENEEDHKSGETVH